MGHSLIPENQSKNSSVFWNRNGMADLICCFINAKLAGFADDSIHVFNGICVILPGRDRSDQVGQTLWKAHSGLRLIENSLGWQ